jgi:hypothetical protein
LKSKIKQVLQSAPSKAQAKNTFDGEKRSAIVKSENSSVPAIKPNCTADVKFSKALVFKVKLAIKSFSTALLANHKEVQQNCEITIIGSILLRCIINAANLLKIM